MATIEASKLVQAIEQVWAAIQDRHQDVPAVVVTLGSGSISGGMKLGHFAAHRWTAGGSDEAGAEVEAEWVSELFVGGEGLRLGAAELLDTLLHEAAHGLALARGIQDTSRQGRYHNAKFKALAEEMGLTSAKVGAIGWSDTKLTEATAAEYADELAALSPALTAYRRAEGMVTIGSAGSEGDSDGSGASGDEQDETKRPKNGLALLCGCDEPRRIRVASSTAELGAITCSVCGDEFTEEA